MLGNFIKKGDVMAVNNMLGRDLILYILENNLENEPVFKNGKLLGFMTVEEAAVKFEVGEAPIWLWVSLDMLKGIKIGNLLFIPANSERPNPQSC